MYLGVKKILLLYMIHLLFVMEINTIKNGVMIVKEKKLC